MDLRVLPERLSVSRLPVTAPWPVPRPGTSFFSVTRTGDELSVVSGEDERAKWLALLLTAISVLVVYLTNRLAQPRKHA